MNYPATRASRLAPEVNEEHPPTHLVLTFRRVLGAHTTIHAFDVDPATRDEVSSWEKDDVVSDCMADKILDKMVEMLADFGSVAAHVYLEHGDVYVLSYTDAEGKIQIDHCYAESGWLRLDELPFISSIRWARS